MSKRQMQNVILELKKKTGAVLLVHNYQRPEIQEIADYLGDSLDLSRAAMDVDSDLLVFCGVHFMAETAKILSPQKTVLLPERDAGCPLADCASVDDVKAMRSRYPEAVFLAYVNTSAEVKAECDCCVTSANALQIIRHFHDRQIVYLPDRNLAGYAEHLLQRSIIQWPGQCYVHDRLIKPEDVRVLQKKHPQAVVMAHPEVKLEILLSSDIVTGTNGMITAARERDEKEFIVVTESGLVHRLRRECPGKSFFEIEHAVCGQMKLTTLPSVESALRLKQHCIEVPEPVAVKARRALQKMLDLTR